jgi:hydroxyacylglutathione hydrolase
MSLLVAVLPALEDNYIFFLKDEATGTTAVVDPAEAAPVRAELARRGERLDWILNTHHHGDHVGGNRELQAATGCRIAGAAHDATRIPGIEVLLQPGEVFSLGEARLRVIDVPGHTHGHIAYFYAPLESGDPLKCAAARREPGRGEQAAAAETGHPRADAREATRADARDEDKPALFCGDTLFGMGCGRLFEGTPREMWSSLAQFKSLPPETRVYCAHEYTAVNGRFALTVEPHNPALHERLQDVHERRARGEFTIPTTMALELATNPFLRARDEAEFTARREARNHFRG